MTSNAPKTLHLNFHGRIIDHLGIQMYQSPVAAVAEMVSNSWDADAEHVRITLPPALLSDSEIVVADDGNGMTLDQCERRFLEVGYNRRHADPMAKSSGKERPILGRKGIGKFAGFGIATVIRVETVSRENGERTVFELDADKLRGDDYIGEGSKDIDVLEYKAPDDGRRSEHGTTIRLRRLTMAERPSPTVFGKSMARRFLLHQRVADFDLRVNGEELPESEELEKAQFIFPRDYEVGGRRPKGLTLDEDGWGREAVGAGRAIRWRFTFYPDPIDEKELQGVAVFAHGKLAQTPFDFNLVGGLGGQHGIEYLSGAVEADFVDELPMDVIAPERQRIDWNRPDTQPLLSWGQRRVKELLPVWQELRGKEKLDALVNKLEPFAQRLDKLPTYERRIVEGALKKLAGITKINNDTFGSLADSMLTAWEGGRLKELISQVSATETLTAEEFVDLLWEAEVMTSLHTGEAVKTKLTIIDGLRQRIAERELENPLRDYIAEHPWLISPKWETFQREKSVANVLAEAVREAKLDREKDWGKRIDLVLSSGDSLLILEFMMPGLTIDHDHISRFQFYVTAIEQRLEAQTGGQFRRIEGGYLIADRIDKSPTVISYLKKLEADGLRAMDWETLLQSAEAQWAEFIQILARRAPEDERLQLMAEAPVGEPAALLGT